MMMGKAYFYKQDYNQAKRVFNYVVVTYDWGSVEEATVWLARCQMQQDYFVNAQSLLEEVRPAIAQNKIKTSNANNNDEVKAKTKTPPKKKMTKYQKQRAKAIAKREKEAAKREKSKASTRKVTNDVRLQYYAAGAEYHLLAPNKDFEEAIDNIKLALRYRPKKDFKVRLYFILGQLYERLENQSEAQNWFLKVIRAAPVYEMEFSARMHLAGNYDGTPMSKRTVMRELNKLLKDPKNEDYRDQIYYAFSEIARVDDHSADREFYLAQSVAAYTRNDYQRTTSALTLADIYFEDEEYVGAQAYYDTALFSLPSNFPNRANILKKASVLRDLVENLNMIHLQDSLQRIAKMSESERRNWVNRMIAAYTEEERRLAKEEADRMLALSATQNFANVNVNTQGQSNKWYFYNPGLVSQGSIEFYRRFGNRKLEDNWRISNRTVISFEDMDLLNSGMEQEEEEELDEDGNPIKKRETDPKKPEYYTQDLPMTPGAIDTSNQLIANAMYNAGIIYFDQLKDFKRSNEMLEKLIKRFPDSDLVPPSYFILWTNYTKLKNGSKAEEVKNIILTKYPDSDYAKLILDPNYYKKMAEAAQEHERRYEELYRVYSNKQWRNTVHLADDLLAVAEDKTLASKTSYLRAIAIGQLEDRDALREALTQIVQNYPKEPVADLAKVYLAALPASGAAQGKTTDPTGAATAGINPIPEVPEIQESPFNPNLDEVHSIIVLVNIHKRNVTDVQYDISNFNATYFSLERFNVNNIYISQEEQMVTIARFSNKTNAMNYYTALTTNDVFSSSIHEGSLTVYPISSSNYFIYYSNVGARRGYKTFVEENYLK